MYWAAGTMLFLIISSVFAGLWLQGAENERLKKLDRDKKNNSK